jgi:hypothetical protein
MLTVGKYGMRSFQVSDVKKQFGFREYLCSRYITTVSMVVISIGYITFSTYKNGYSLDKSMVMLWMVFFKVPDAVVAEYAWDYGAGKEVMLDGDTVHKNTIHQINIDTDIANQVRRLTSDSNKLREIQESYVGNKPDYILKIHMGAVASGSAVIANSEKIREIQEQIRDVLAVDMEVFGVYYAARWAERPRPKIIVKIVCSQVLYA